MTYKGKVKNGVVVLDGDVCLPNDAEVRIELVGEAQGQTAPASSWAEVLKDVIGRVDDWPADMAERHDHYINGTGMQ